MRRIQEGENNHSPLRTPIF